MTNQAWKSWIRAILMLVFMLPGMLMAAEGARPDVSFNHDQTRFKLTGFHTNVACESCHVKGVFKGTPTTCIGCHGQGGTALSTTAATKTTNHIPTTQDCGVCHKTDTFSSAIFSHNQLTQPCSTCHNGRIQTGKPVTHIMTSQDCGVCHKTTAWTPAGYDHAGLVIGQGGCTQCHNGVTATTKPSGHILTTQQCDVCHKTFNAWIPAGYTHAVSDTNCSSCHNGSMATGKPTRHIQTSQQCSDCHTQQAWLPSFFDHSVLVGYPNLNCQGCHNGTTATGVTARHLPSGVWPAGATNCNACHNFTGWRPSTFVHNGVASGTCSNCHIGGYTGATVKPTVHLPTGSQACDVCHSAKWSWLPSYYDHTGASGVCSTCHNGTNATGRPTTHMQGILATSQCDTCHTTVAWKPAAMNHVGQTSCSTCHAYAGNTWTPAYSGHLNTSGRQCSDCHTSVTSWVGPVFDHKGISVGTNCASSCHDGTHATGRPTSGISAHLVSPMTNGTCGTCHTIATTAGTTFKTNPVMDHTGATACSSCHSYSVSMWSTPGTGPKTLTNHIVTSAQCSSCHLSTFSWVGARVDHASMTVATNCFSGCHDGTHGTGKPTSGAMAHMTAPMTNNTCGACHSNKGVAWLPRTMNNHTGATSCSSCHSFSTASAWTPGAPRTGGSLTSHQATSGSQCSVCHKSFVSFAGAHIDHTPFALSMDCRTSCHDGNFGTGAPTSGTSPHSVAPMSGPNCGNCHAAKGVSWITSLAMNHNGATACANCHSYTVKQWTRPGSPTYAGHISTNQQCSVCHNSFASWTGPTYAHSGVAQGADCYTGCHDGTHATGRPTTGVSAHSVSPMTANTCGSCHAIGTGGGITFRSTRTMNGHSGAVACSSCHSFTTAKWSNPGSPVYTNHLVTTAQCSTCHSNTAGYTSWALGTVDHSGFTNATTCTTGCHDGTHATGLPTSGTSAHLVTPMSTGNCGLCHKPNRAPGETFATVRTMNNHTGASACSSCHSYSVAKWSNPGSPTYASHITTSRQCSDCHAGYVNWTGATFDHAGISISAATDCFSGCHDGAHLPALGKPSNHVYAPMNSNTCASCHNSTTSWTSPASKVARMNGHTGAAVCSNCHSYTVQGQGWTINGASFGSTKPVPGHPATSAQCSSCHAVAAGWANNVHNGVTVATTCGISGCHGTPGQSTPASGRPISGGKAHSVAPMTNNNCGSCHSSIGGTWAKPGGASMNHAGATLCSSCHSYTTNPSGWTVGANNSPPVAGHPVTSSQCSNCHTTTAPKWASNVHNGVTNATSCGVSGCHGTPGQAVPGAGRPSAGSKAHTAAPMTNATCGSCHANAFNTKVWTGGTMNNHTGATLCSSCHSFSVASTWTPGAPRTGASLTSHQSTSASQCSACHNTTAFTGATYSHSGVTAVTNCTQCHLSGNTTSPKGTAAATAAGSPHSSSPMTLTTCGACHTIGGAWAPANMSHTGLSAGSTCSAAGCHDTNNRAAPRAGKPTAGSGSGTFPHGSAPMTLGTCATCHSIGGSWSTVTMSHTGISTDCTTSGCHGADAGTTTPRSAKPAGPTKLHTVSTMAANTCGNCHVVGSAWAPATMNHVGAGTGAACATCHNGTAWIGKTTTAIHTYATAQGWFCDRCHTTTAFKPAVYDHTGVAAGSCANCHDGTAATGATAAHPPSTLGISATFKCDACHRTTAWKPTTFAHSGVTNNCEQCHKTGFATAKSAAHFITTVTCEKCHTTTAWAPIKSYVHVSIYYKKHTAPNMTVYADCKLCHINNNEAISGAPHKGNAAYAKDCAWCHAAQFVSGSHKKQEAVAPTTYYTVAELKDCGGACHLYTNNTYTTIKTNRTGHHKSTDTGF